MARIVVPAHTDHLFWLANNMARADREECEAICKGPYRALAESLEHSVVAWTGMVDDAPVLTKDRTTAMQNETLARSLTGDSKRSERPVCMFGVAPMDILGGVGSPWLLGTSELRKYAVTFLRLNKKYVAKMLDLFPRLVNYVDVRNEVSIRWLKWLGFKFDPGPVPYGIWGMPFYRFEMRLWDL